MPLLIRWFRNHGFDAASAQMAADRAGGIRLVTPERVRSRPRPAGLAFDSQLRHQRQQHRRVAGLTGGDERGQREPVAIDKLMDLRREPAARAADAVIRRLERQIRVVRSSPL